MSALADILIAGGKSVTGSDLRPNSITDKLKDKGAVIYKGHSGDNLTGEIDLVVKTSCIRDNNPEIEKAREKGVPIITRGELLKSIMEEAGTSVAVTGTHGKTTTSALIAHILEACGKDPTFAIGGEIGKAANARSGKSGIMVAEVDESDGFFRNIGSTCAAITNIEREHMEHYGNMENLIDAYKEFIGRISPEGALFYNGEDALLSGMVKGSSARAFSFGIDGSFDVGCEELQHAKNIEFELVFSRSRSGRVKSSLIGRHNAMNLLAAIGICSQIGVAPDDIIKAISSFSGVGRRFDRVAKIGDVEVVEDYAHHPTELFSVIHAARDYSDGRTVVVFQPHRHSRTADLAEDFMTCFNEADVLILTDVYSADEDRAEGAGVRDIFENMNKKSFELVDLVEKDRVPERVSSIVRGNDVILILGAGDIRDVSGELVERIKKKRIRGRTLRHGAQG